MGNLTVLKMKALTEPGRYSDGDGLIPDVSAKGSASWLLRIMIAGTHKSISASSLVHSITIRTSVSLSDRA